MLARPPGTNMATWLSLLAASTATEDDLGGRFCMQAFGGCRFAELSDEKYHSGRAREGEERRGKGKRGAGRGFSTRGKRDGERVRLDKPGERNSRDAE
ncbi:hypothetical protein PR202_ga00021 [Eleusine coracana subsp. coracana]|uniref:Secreted protein n=1 Tax=Eleusine coracana subsp. coracana TaxID=191504 RepID=A0AAV5BAM0_ELECO|nr:hypothetical protein PR202_ga00021 [Eleusine coracana subsp. coracana]